MHAQVHALYSTRRPRLACEQRQAQAQQQESRQCEAAPGRRPCTCTCTPSLGMLPTVSPSKTEIRPPGTHPPDGREVIAQTWPRHGPHGLGTAQTVGPGPGADGPDMAQTTPRRRPYGPDMAQTAQALAQTAWERMLGALKSSARGQRSGRTPGLSTSIGWCKSSGVLRVHGSNRDKHVASTSLLRSTACVSARSTCFAACVLKLAC